MSFTIQKITDLEEAKKYWNILTPDQSIYDVWDFRYCAYKLTNYELIFYVGFEDGEPIGLLPLEYNTAGKYLEFFGGSYMEDNKIFLKKGYEERAITFWQAIDQPAKLGYITANDAYTKNFPIMEYRYSLDLSGCTTIEQYLDKYLEGKQRKEVSRRIQKTATMHQVEIVRDAWEDLPALFSNNKEYFGDASTFYLPNRELLFAEFSHSTFNPTLLTFIVDGVKVAFSFALVYKDTFYSLNSGLSRLAPKDFNTYIKIARIQEALARGLRFYDARAYDCGWKQSWNFDAAPLHEFNVGLPA